MWLCAHSDGESHLLVRIITKLIMNYFKESMRCKVNSYCLVPGDMDICLVLPGIYKYQVFNYLILTEMLV